MSLEAQGSRTDLGPYRTLQLHPLAPRDLITEAYWALIARQKRQPPSPSVGQQIEALNRAYGLLIDDVARAAYDADCGDGERAPLADGRRTRGLSFFRSGKPGAAVVDHYEALKLDQEADGQMVEVAYAVATRAAHSGQGALQRIEAAHRILSDPQLRADYDAERRETPGARKSENYKTSARIASDHST